MEHSISYKRTIVACYIGNFIQAIVINLTPILFIPLREEFGLSYGQFGILVLVNFVTQVLTDIAFSKAIDKWGFRPFVVASHGVCALGLLLFAGVPFLFKNHIYFGFLVATMIFSCGGGLLELLLSPIIDAIPSDEKGKAMALLHSFYAWGQVTVIVVTTLLIFIRIKWTIIVALWAITPILNLILFAKAPLVQKHEGMQMMKIRELLVHPVFLIAFGAMIFGGASEITMAQWASSFMEKGLNLPKIVGDMLGMCGFAVMLGVGRLIYGIYGTRINIGKILIYGSAFAGVSYIIVALSPNTAISVFFCAMTGICVSLMWPGTLVIASERLPMAGASMFALLAAAGDIGSSIGPYVTGIVTDFSMKFIGSTAMLTAEQMGLRIGILLATVFPVGAFIFHLQLNRKKGTKYEKAI